MAHGSHDGKLWFDIALAVGALVVAAPWIGWVLALLIGAGAGFAVLIRAWQRED